MARAAAVSIDAVIQTTVQEVVARASRPIANAIAQMAATELEKQLAVANGRPRRYGRSRPRQRAEITKWVADRRARRVPTFVIEMTGGLDTKKKIVAKFGENAAFEKGKPLPAASAAAHRAAPGSAAVAARIVKARPPVVRKAVGK